MSRPVPCPCRRPCPCRCTSALRPALAALKQRHRTLSGPVEGCMQVLTRVVGPLHQSIVVGRSSLAGPIETLMLATLLICVRRVLLQIYPNMRAWPAVTTLVARPRGSLWRRAAHTALIARPHQAPYTSTKLLYINHNLARHYSPLVDSFSTPSIVVCPVSAPSLVSSSRLLSPHGGPSSPTPACNVHRYINLHPPHRLGLGQTPSPPL